MNREEFIKKLEGAGHTKKEIETLIEKIEDKWWQGMKEKIESERAEEEKNETK
jgi:hypothetical protein